MSYLASRLTTVCVLEQRHDNGAPDEYGQPTRTLDRTLSRCRLDPVPGSETVEGAEAELERVLLETTLELTAHDAVITSPVWTFEALAELTQEQLDALVTADAGDGTARVLEFTAAPDVMHDALGRVHHVEGTLRRAT